MSQRRLATECPTIRTKIVAKIPVALHLLKSYITLMILSFDIPPGISAVKPIVRVNKPVAARGFLLCPQIFTSAPEDDLTRSIQNYNWSEHLQKAFAYIADHPDTPSSQTFPAVVLPETASKQRLTIEILHWHSPDPDPENFIDKVVLSASTSFGELLIHPNNA